MSLYLASDEVFTNITCYKLLKFKTEKFITAICHFHTKKYLCVKAVFVATAHNTMLGPSYSSFASTIETATGQKQSGRGFRHCTICTYFKYLEPYSETTRS